MSIYRIFNPNRDYKTIDYSETPILDNLGKIYWENQAEISSFPYTWVKDERKDICDCPFIIGSVPVFNEVAYKTITNYLNKNEMQIIPIHVEGIPYYIVNSLRVLPDILNEKKSKIVRFSDGRIMDIEKYVFQKKEEVPNIFKISQLNSYTFVDKKMASIIIDAHLKGIYLEKCKISTSILSFR